MATVSNLYGLPQCNRHILWIQLYERDMCDVVSGPLGPSTNARLANTNAGLFCTWPSTRTEYSSV